MRVLRKAKTLWVSLNPMQRACVRLWLFFSVVLGFVPVPTAWLTNMFFDKADAHPVRHGDLLLLAALLCFAGIASLFRPRTDGKQRAMTGLATGTLVLAVFNIILYTVFSSATKRHDDVVNVLSGLLYGGSALCSLVCTVVAEGDA